jgi:protocatechuate 3,4-dioxygenase beta subunit
VAGALVDLWHADERGDYDNAGFRYRGHLFNVSTVRPCLSMSAT